MNRRSFLIALSGAAYHSSNSCAETKIAAGEAIDVRAFGAKGDGTTDDAPAINKAINEARDRVVRTDRFRVIPSIRFPYGVYRVLSSINLTGLDCINTLIDGCGSAIIGCCSSRPVLDMTGTRFARIQNLSVIGQKDHAPSVGIQIGIKKIGENADGLSLSNIKVVGSFKVASILNSNAEICYFEKIFAWNDCAEGKCLIQDGAGTNPFHSDFIDVNRKDLTSSSFNENVFISCDFRHSSVGTPVQLTNTSRHEFIRCFAASDGLTSFEMNQDYGSNSMLTIDCHCETEKLTQALILKSDYRNDINIHGLALYDHYSFVSQQLIGVSSNVTRVRISDLDIRVPSFSNKAAQILQRDKLWDCNGSIFGPEYLLNKKLAVLDRSRLRLLPN